MKVKQFATEPLEVNCYVCSSDGEAIVIDPGGSGHDILQYVVDEQLVVRAVINTHGHGDHIMGNEFLVKATEAPLWIHQDDAEFLTDPQRNLSLLMGAEVAGPQADGYLADGDVISFGRSELTVWHTPGHTAGSICLVGGGLVFSGDTLFTGSQGRTDLPGGDQSQMQSSLERLVQLPEDTMVYPGHGASTTIGKERRSNPYVQEVLR